MVCICCLFNKPLGKIHHLASGLKSCCVSKKFFFFQTCHCPLSTNVNMVDVELLTTEVKWLASDYRVISIGFAQFRKPNPKNNTPRERLLITKIRFSRNYPLITWLPFPWFEADFHQHIVVSTNWYYIDTKHGNLSVIRICMC